MKSTNRTIPWLIAIIAVVVLGIIMIQIQETGTVYDTDTTVSVDTVIPK